LQKQIDEGEEIAKLPVNNEDAVKQALSKLDSWYDFTKEGGFMYSKILVPLDGSGVAECVLPHVETLAAVDKAVYITLLHVVQSIDMLLPDQIYKAQIKSDARTEAEKYIRGIINRLKNKGKIHGEVIIGKAADGILDYAKQNDIKLIVMSSHGQSGISRWSNGSVADKVLHESGIPILRIRADSPRTPFYIAGQKMKVVVPLDGSELAERVLNNVKGLVDYFGAGAIDIVLLRVCELFIQPNTYPPSMSLNWEEYVEFETRVCKGICMSYLNKVKKRFKRELIYIRSVVPVGNPADEVIKYVNKEKADLMVMSTHGRSGISQWAFGSISNKILKGTSTPVLMLRSNHKGQIN
jgi:nucleotide-binding universal stress UspA family protein